MNQIIAGLALFFGEVLIIGAEMWAARYFDSTKPWAVIVSSFIVSIIGVILLICGYTYGYQTFKNIWIVMALSVAGILIVEPLLAWFLFHELPTTGATIALILGIIGIVLSIVVK
jgi:hypothetical protein